MPARLIRNRKFRQGGLVIQERIWQLPAAAPGSRHRYKYSLYCGRDGQCLVRYDNERGKGDHRHEGDLENAYPFTTLEQLLEDFIADVTRLIKEK
ncbi:MAG: hypothetical protein HZB71_09405 [Betaproteobacteria bacterium]|nr:hypothetical protein [Betaproteobacteria bacterium]